MNDEEFEARIRREAWRRTNALVGSTEGTLMPMPFEHVQRLVETELRVAQLTDRWLGAAVDADDATAKRMATMVAELRALLPDDLGYDNG